MSVRMNVRVKVPALVGAVLVAMLSASSAAGETKSAAAAANTAADAPVSKPAPSPATKPAPATNTPPKPRPDGAIVALVKAAADPDPKRLEALIRSGAPIHGRTARDETPLQSAAAAGVGPNVLTLLSHGADLNALGARGTTALGWAARNGHEPIVRMLLDAGAGPDVAADAAHSPIALAARGDHKAIASLLIERGSKLYEIPDLAGAVLVALGEANSLPLAAELVPRMVGLVVSSAAFRQAAADAIVSSNATIGQVIAGQLGAAAESRELQTALLLTAARRKRSDIAATAVAHGADVNARHPTLGTPLAAAVALSDADTVAVLLSAGADWRSASGEADKMSGIAGERLDNLREAELIASIGSPDVRDNEGQTPLFRVAERGDVGGVSTLLRFHANPAATVRRWPGDEGWTALMAAAAGGHTAVVEQLLAAGAPVDQRNGAGRTALGFAAFYGRAQAVVVLLHAGADPDVVDHDGLTPNQLAKAGGESVTVALLRNRGKTTDAVATVSGKPK